MEPFELWLEFEHWEPTGDEDPEDDFFNMAIHLSNGLKYALNVWAFKFLVRIQREQEASGENLSGKYVLPPDLFVQKLDRTGNSWSKSLRS